MEPIVYRTVLIPWEGKGTPGYAERFIVPLGKMYAVYVPRKNICAYVNKTFVEKIDSDNPLVLSLNKLIDFLPLVPTSNTDKINQMMISLTSDCNMRCRYCYVSGGETPQYMSWPTAKAAIDYAVKRSINEFNIVFQGAGEPTLAFDMMKRCCDYAKKLCSRKHKRLKISITSNGVFGKPVLEWVKGLGKSLDLTISFDGTPEIQNSNRPLKNGLPSYSVVKRTIEQLNRREIDYKVSTTFTSHGISNMLGIMKHFKKLGIKKVASGFVDEQGRCKKNDIRAPSMSEGLKQHEVSSKFARRFDMQVRDFMDCLTWNVSKCDPKFVVMTDGDISACPSVMDVNGPFASTFFYGKIKNGIVKINQRKLDYLRNRTTDKIPTCRDCFVKWKCNACPYEALRDGGSIYSPSDAKCRTIRKIFKKNIKELFTL